MCVFSQKERVQDRNKEVHADKDKKVDLNECMLEVKWVLKDADGNDDIKNDVTDKLKALIGE